MQPSTLRRRLTVLFGGWVALFLVVSGIVVLLGYGRFHRDVLAQRLLLARTVAQSIDGSLANTFLGLRRLRADLGQLEGKLEPRLRNFRLHSIFRDAVYILDEDGRMIASDPELVEPLDFRLLPRHETVTPLVVKESSPERPVLAISQPFQKSGRLFYLVAEMVPLGSPICTQLQDLAPENDPHVVLIDRRAKVVAAPDFGQLYRDFQGGGSLLHSLEAKEDYLADEKRRRAPDVDSHLESLLTVMSPLRLAPWGVVVQQHRASAFATLYALQAGLAASAVVLLLFGLLLSRALTRSVVQPIQALSLRAEGLRRGDLETPILAQGDYEIEVLASTLDEARRRLLEQLDELRELNLGLEHQVAERTEAIETQLQDLRRLHRDRQGLIRRLLTASEEERRRIARELHDETSQMLTVIQLTLEGGEETASVREARELLKRTQDEIHRLIHDLRPSLLDDLGLAAALEWYAENYLSSRGIEVSVEVAKDLELPPEVEIVTFRICQEMVTNILRHAEAESVSLELYESDGELVLAMEDDGRGFDPETVEPGAGITGMKERASLIGGDLELDSEPDMGTHVQLRIPLPRP